MAAQETKLTLTIPVEFHEALVEAAQIEEMSVEELSLALLVEAFMMHADGDSEDGECCDDEDDECCEAEEPKKNKRSK